MSDSSIVIRGAREHNLRDIDVSIPREDVYKRQEGRRSLSGFAGRDWFGQDLHDG